MPGTTVDGWSIFTSQDEEIFFPRKGTLALDFARIIHCSHFCLRDKVLLLIAASYILHPPAAVVSSLKSPFFVGGEYLNSYRRKLDPGQQYCMFNLTFSEIVGEYCPISVIFFSDLIDFGFLPLACLYQLLIIKFYYYFFADIVAPDPGPSHP